jgi:transposase
MPDLGSSLRGLTRTFGVSRTTVSNWIKKKECSFPFQYDFDGP